MSDASRHLPVVTVDELLRPESGPKRVTSLAARRSPLAAPSAQLATLEALDLSDQPHAGDFQAFLRASVGGSLRPVAAEIVQVNLGKLCNMTCAHCHVDAGPDRVDEMMSRETAEAVLRAIDLSGARTVDLTGGAPELHPDFRWLVEECASRGLHVIDRCNLTVLLLPRLEGLPDWLAERGVEVVCSLPHHRRLNTDAQRGEGAWAKSLEALRLLNGAGYGQGDPSRRLTLVSNPAGAFLAGSQAALEKEWKAALERDHGVRFDRLLCLNNMPISRFLEWLVEKGNLAEYLERLLQAANPATLSGLMCRNTLSVSWDGRLFDCDFNQMLDLELERPELGPARVEDVGRFALEDRSIVTGRHCFGCTAGAGSSCGGAIEA